MFLYRLTSPSNKSYIGVAKDMVERFRDHSRGSSAIGSAIRKYGAENIKVEILMEGEPEFCYYMEELAIDHLRTLFPNGYNLASGGKGIRRHIPETRAKMSIGIKAALNKPEAKADASRRATAQWADPEMLQKNKDGNKKAWSEPERLAQHSERMKAVFATPTIKATLSAAQIKSWKNPTTRANRLIGINRRKHNKET